MVTDEEDTASDGGEGRMEIEDDPQTGAQGNSNHSPAANISDGTVDQTCQTEGTVGEN